MEKATVISQEDFEDNAEKATGDNIYSVETRKTRHRHQSSQDEYEHTGDKITESLSESPSIKTATEISPGNQDAVDQIDDQPDSTNSAEDSDAATHGEQINGETGVMDSPEYPDSVNNGKEEDETIDQIRSTLLPTTVCPKCDTKNIEKQTKIEIIKQQLLGKLGLSSVPQVKGPLHPLPFDFYRGEDFAQNDEEERGSDRSRPITRQIFVFGEDSKLFFNSFKLNLVNIE